MKVALIGASGFVGAAVLNELAERGHLVTAVVRNPENLKQTEQITVIKADVLKEAEMVNAVQGMDAVISAYNAGWGNPDLYKTFIEGSKAIQVGVKKAGVKRLIVIGGAGSLYITEGVQLIDSPDFPFPDEFKPGSLAARDYYNIIKEEKELDWTFVSPAIKMTPETSGVRRGTYRTGFDTPVFDSNNRSILSVEDLAVVVVDELENPKHIKQRFTAAY